MSTAELLDKKFIRQILRQRIDSIDDQETLNAILTLTDKCYVPKPLTAAQLRDIEISEQQFAEGLGISHEDAMKIIDPEFQGDEDED
ncbi:MAG: hypothetical protein LBC02_13810 [Planctomycetaceae bacterium]|jgi:hypothetical protein|nr:hypothetical protein [Planctomycetaceae bacterium]